MDMLVSSGDQVESYLSYAAKHVPFVVEDKNLNSRKVFKINQDLFLSTSKDKTIFLNS